MKQMALDNLTPSTPCDNLAWWREARFGMFIHWGVYSATEGFWNGVETKGIGEWIQCREQIPLAEYRKFASQLTLEKFDAEEYVALAKEAGMKYIVLTSKHHDGFAMFDSQYSDYNVVKMGPSRRDPAKELADAARKAGLTMCFYYSQAHDWEDPDATGNTWDFDPAKKDFSRFLNGKCKNQLREILTNYGPLGLIWFDVPQGITRDQSIEIREFVHSIQPRCLVSGRISAEPGIGDYGSLGDNQLPAGRLKGDWETPATLNDTWGYKRNDNRWKSTEQLVRLLVEVVSKGANYLLNIGPKADGEIPAESVTRLKEMGRWMAVNQEAVYGTSASPFASNFEWGRAAMKGNNLYLYLFDWQPHLSITGLRNQARKAVLLANPGFEVRMEQRHDAASDYHMISLTLPEKAPGDMTNVIRLELDGSPDVLRNPCQQPDGSVHLPAYMAELRRQPLAAQASGADKSEAAQAAENFNLAKGREMSIDPSGVVVNWFSAGSSIRWKFRLYTPGTYQMELRTFSKKYEPWVGGHQVRVECNGQTACAVLKVDSEPETASRQFFNETASMLGAVTFPAAGEYELTLHAERINADDPAGLCVSELIIK